MLQRWFLVAFAILSPAVLLHTYLAGSWAYVFHVYSLAMVFGIIAYVYFANALVLAARIPYFDHLYGHDRVMVFHGYLAAAGIACALTHAGLKIAYYGIHGVQVSLGIAATVGFVVVALVTLLFMIESSLHRISLLMHLHSAAARHKWLDYTRLKSFHNLTGVAMILAMVHVLMALPTQETSARIALAGGWGGLAILAWVYHKVVRVLIRLRTAYAITQVETPSDGITRLDAQPRAGRKAKPFTPGQFGYFRILSTVCGTEEHPFTIASPPQASSLAIVAKALGDYSAALARLEPGARLLFDGPYGRFTPTPNAAPYLFIAGGIGITPFMSIIADWETRDIETPVELVWSVRHRSELVDRGLFERVAQRCEWFTYTALLTRDAEEPGQHVSSELLRPMIENLKPDKVQMYVCGPSPLLKAILGIARGAGVTRRQVHYEAFAS